MVATSTTTRWEPVTPWWQRAHAPWKGEMFDRMNLQPDNPREQRIQLYRQEVMHRPEGKRARVSSHRARLLTESYRQTEGQSPVMRRAKAFCHILDNIPIPFSRYSLLAGNPAAIPNAVEFFPEYTQWSSQIVIDGRTYTELEAMPIRRADAMAIAEADRRLLEEDILPYWKGKTHADFTLDFIRRHAPDVLRHERETEVIRALVDISLSHTIQDYRAVMERGIRGFQEEIRTEMAKLDLAYPTEGVRTFERREMYEAMLMVADGMVRYTERCADEAERLAAQESDPERAAELREMARISRKVPAHPAETFREAVQSLHFCHMITGLVEGGGSHSFGRLDQYLYPYLKADLAAGRTTREEAQEILECLWLKVYDYTTPLSWESSKGLHAFRTNDKITIGGTDEFGRDVTNELTYMCLEAQAHTHLQEPNLSLRLHRKTPDDLLKRTLEVIRVGSGLPQLINDEVIVPGLMGTVGVSVRDARNYADIGCQENVSDPNMTDADTNAHSNTGFFNLPKTIELAIWNGYNPITDKAGAPQTGDVRSFKTMDEFAAAVREQIERAVHINAIANNAVEYSFVRHMPCVYHNLMHPGPRHTAIDINAGGCKYNWTGNLSLGLGTAADCLAAIDTLIYREKSVTWDELQAALKANWVGHEELRSKCIAAPKYGTDNDFADAWGKFVADALFTAYEKHPTTKGGIFVGGLISMSFYEYLGRQTGATPDGRRSSEMISDTVAPSPYAPALGPTATHRSVTKAVDAVHCVNGVTFNQKFNASAVASERDLSKWADLVRTYVEAGGQSVQYTVVDRRTLQAAQKNPERYTDLVVRVGGYSALFNELTKEVQDTIINRIEQEI